MVYGIIVLDSSFTIKGIDKQIIQLFGYDYKEVDGQPLSFYIPNFDIEKYNNEQALDNSEITIPCKTKNGVSFNLQYCIHAITDQNENTYIVTVTESSAVFAGVRQQGEDNQADGQEWLSYLLHSSPVVIYSCVPSGNFATTFISDNITALTGYTPVQYLSDPSFWLEHLHPDDKDRLLAEMAELFETDQSHSYEYRFLTASGDYIWVLDKLKISRDLNGKPSEMMGLWLDISSRKQNEDSLSAANDLLHQKSSALSDSNAELSQFTYVVSHDLKAPLRAIHSYCDWLSDDMEGKLEPDQQEYIAGMQDAVQQAEALIEDLLELSRVGRRSAQVESIDLSDFFKELTHSVITDNSVEIEITEMMPTIDVSATVLTQVFQNLITNAVIYNKSDPKIISILGRKEGSNYIISVADNGIGIEDKFHDRVFQLFQRLHTKEEIDGTGIGLAIVQKAVSHLGWEIDLTSALNQGSTFSVTFPINEGINNG